MLQHYSPFKVAETFRVLASLAPGRVDLGIGKAPGGLPLTTRALQWFHDKAKKPDFAHQLAELDAFLKWGVAEDHPLAGAVALPTPPEPPERILLGASAESAALAAQHGWQFCYAGHFNGDEANIERSIDAYRNATGRTPLLALYAFAAPSKRSRARQVGGAANFQTAACHRAERQSAEPRGGSGIRAADGRDRLSRRRIAPACRRRHG